MLFQEVFRFSGTSYRANARFAVILSLVRFRSELLEIFNLPVKG